MSKKDNLLNKIMSTTHAPRELLVEYIRRESKELNGERLASQLLHVLLQQEYVNWEDDPELAHIEAIAIELIDKTEDPALWRELFERVEKLDIITFYEPKNKIVFDDSSDDWKLFRKEWSTQFGIHGNYVVIRQLNLSGYDLKDFPADHIAFVQCKLDGVSFKNTQFQFETAFINCSTKNADLSETLASNALFLGCDLTGVKISPKSPYTQWTSADLDGKDIPTIFSNCKIGEVTKEYLTKNKCVFDPPAADFNDKLERIAAAPVLDL